MNELKRKKIDMKTVRWIIHTASSSAGSLAALFLVKVMQGFVGICFAFLLRAIIDAAANADTAAFRKGLVLCAIIIAAEVFLYWFAIYYKDKPAAVLTKNIKSMIFGELLLRSYSEVSKVHTGEWMTRINSDAAIIASAITAIVPGTAGLIVQLVCAFAAMFLVLPRLAWLLIPLGGAMLAVSLIMRLKLKAFHMEVQKNEGISYSFLQESLGSMRIIRAYTRETLTRKEAEDRLDGVVDAKLRRTRFICLCASCVYAFVRISYYLGVVVCGFRLLDGVITYGMMAAVLQLIRQADLPLSEVTTAVPQFFNMIASAERLMEIEKLPPDHTGIVRTPKEARSCYDSDLESIGLSDVCFRYSEEDAENVVSHLDLEIRKGDCVAFTGESGCGKSTTMNLLMGLYKPESGRLFVKRRGRGEEELDAGWRALFAYVPQENLLMSGRIRDIVAFADPGSVGEDEKIWEALRIACAEVFVRELPEGIDTELGERGAGLSEGQMQRIAIARAIFSDRPVLMLDEATSALDEDTERQLLDNLQAVTDRTVVIITHRPAALRICNRRIAFRKGDVS